MAPNKTRSPIFPGWFVLAGAFCILFTVHGARTIIGVVFKPMIQELAWSRGDLSTAAFINLAVFALSLTVVGRYYDRYGARRIIVGASLILGVSYIAISRIHSLGAFYLLYGVCAALGFGGASIPLFGALISKWFHRHRGLAISLAFAGGCLGQYIIVPAATQLVAALGWRQAFMVLGVLVLVVNLLLALLLIKEKPQDLGLQPFGLYRAKPLSPAKKGSGTATAGETAGDRNLRQAMGTSSFWFYLAVMFVCGGGDFLVLTHLVPLVTDHGIAPTTAGNMLGWVGFFSLLGVLATGPLTDRYGNKRVVLATFLMRTVIILVVCRYQNLWAFYGFALAFGFTLLITAPITTTLLGKMYGFSHVGLISGFITTIHHFSGGLWAWLGGAIFDATGSYLLVFQLSAAAAFIAFLCSLMIREVRHT